MQVQSENFVLFENLLDQSEDILVLVNENPDVDTLAAAVFLENLLSVSGKKVQVIAKGKLPDKLSHLSEKISKKIEPKKLVVSFNWHKNAVEKVSYNLDGENFNFIINPRDSIINEDEIKISHQGKEADLVITLGIESLEQVENHEKKLIENKTIINIGKGDKNRMFGKLNFVGEGADSISSIVAKLIEKTKSQVPKASVELLLLGIREATENFTSVNDPTTFEAAAFCARIKKGETVQRKRQEYIVKPQVPSDWLTPKVFRSKQQAS